uniref:Uncharacterized protein n=1 Tax=Setaria digitata TaxID=48799 RepID=A0A915PZI8_9BILA
MSDEEEEEVETNNSAEDNLKINTSQTTALDLSGSSDNGIKRKRSGLNIPTTSAVDLPPWVAGASPARFVSMEELMEMSVAMENMALVHEIAINPEFVIQKNSTNLIQQAVEDCMKKAYWDKLREDLSRVPPDYSCALVLLGDIKKMIMDLLTQQHVRLRSEIESIMDIDLLRQQAENKCLDVHQLFQNIIELLSRLCAPARDKLVNDLRKKTDSIDVLRQINRSAVEEYSAEYERTQFMKLLEKNPELELSTVGWLCRHVNMDSTDGPSAKKSFEDLNNGEISDIISDAYMELLEWDFQNAYPETLKIDRFRLEALATNYLQLVVCVSCVLVSCSLAGKDVAQLKDFKTNLKNDVIVITNDIDKSNLMERLEAISILCNDRISKCSKTLGLDWSKERCIELQEQILQISNHMNQVRKLIRDRMHAFILSIISNRISFYQQRFPPGLSIIHAELSTLAARFIRIVNHNRQTFGPYYGQLIKRLMND